MSIVSNKPFVVFFYLLLSTGPLAIDLKECIYEKTIEVDNHVLTMAVLDTNTYSIYLF